MLFASRSLSIVAYLADSYEIAFSNSLTFCRTTMNEATTVQSAVPKLNNMRKSNSNLLRLACEKYDTFLTADVADDHRGFAAY